MVIVMRSPIQIADRARRREQRNAEREEEQKKRQLDESARNSNNNKDSVRLDLFPFTLHRTSVLLYS